MTLTPPEYTPLLNVILRALDDLKAQQITILEVGHLTSLADVMVIASGTSSRHVRSLAEHVRDSAKLQQFRPLGIEGEGDAEWVLVDFEQVIVHIMLPSTRHFYDLERLWQSQPA